MHRTRLACALLGLLLAAPSCERAQQPPTQTRAQTVAAGGEEDPRKALVITYEGNPDPPRSGDNAIVVGVREPSGAPVTDVSVTVTYYMPAMPSMNMPEMRDAFPLAHGAGGTYAGTARLSMGGTWLVTIAISRAGETLARRKLTVIARE